MTESEVNGITPKKGRPPKDNPKSVKFQVRLTPDVAQKLQRCADALNISRTETIEKGIDKIADELGITKE